MSHNFASISELVGEEFEHLVQAYLYDKHYTSMVQASFNVVYASINGGIVVLPYAASVSGLPLFCSLLAIFCLISGYVSCMLVQMAQDLSVRRYEDLAEQAFGELGFYTASLLQACFSFLMMVV
jgi:amino acid permease